jgi:SNF2 family DNA or RNA helicase
VLIISYDLMRKYAEELSSIDNLRLLICDEGHRLKNAQSNLMVALEGIPAASRLVITATPIQNNLAEFYSVANFVNPGVMGSADFARYAAKIKRANTREATPAEVAMSKQASVELEQITGNFMIQRSADTNMKLPPRRDFVLFLARSEYLDSECANIVEGPGEHLPKIGKLKQVVNEGAAYKQSRGSAGGFSASLIASAVATSPKVAFVSNFVKAMQGSDEQCIIVATLTSSLDVLEALLASLKKQVLRIDGSTPSSSRQEKVNVFNRSKGKVMLLSSRAGGAGLNLVGANRLIMFDNDWNPSINTQAMGRIHRPGQERTCYIYRIITAGTLDEVVLLRGFSKGNLASKDTGGGGGGSKLSKEENKECLKYDAPGDESRTWAVMDWTSSDAEFGLEQLRLDPVASKLERSVLCARYGTVGDAKKTEEELEEEEEGEYVGADRSDDESDEESDEEEEESDDSMADFLDLREEKEAAKAKEAKTRGKKRSRALAAAEEESAASSDEEEWSG